MNVPPPREVPLLSLEELFGFRMFSEILKNLKFFAQKNWSLFKKNSVSTQIVFQSSQECGH
jgi:hypothetical protein